MNLTMYTESPRWLPYSVQNLPLVDYSIKKTT